MDRSSSTVVRRLGIAGVLTCTLVAAACGGDAVTGPGAVAGPRATAADAGSVTGDVAAGFGLTPDELKAHDWSCRLTPAGTTACSPPGRGLPAFGAPADRPPTYLVHVFDTATSEYLGYGRMIRTDLYQGQICQSTGNPYVELALLGYFECFNPAP